jgi:hypothetical protein
LAAQSNEEYHLFGPGNLPCLSGCRFLDNAGNSFKQPVQNDKVLLHAISFKRLSLLMPLLYNLALIAIVEIMAFFIFVGERRKSEANNAIRAGKLLKKP